MAGEPRARFLEPLAAALREPRLALASAYCLGEIGAAAARASPALIDALRSEDGAVRALAALALARIGVDPGAPLRALLDDRQPFVQKAAQAALWHLAGG